MQKLDRILLGNKAWANEKKQQDPEYFTRLSQGQTPEYLWIGCSDSRVPANEITNTEPGEIFVHRNIANLVVHTDLNLMSVLQYAVEHLKVSHVIVCGHYGCGGVKAAMTRKDFGLMNRWILQIKDTYYRNLEQLNSIADEDQRTNRLVELVAREQLFNIAKTTIIQNAWKHGQQVQLHACVYDLSDGIMKVLQTLEPGADGLPDFYRYEV